MTITIDPKTFTFDKSLPHIDAVEKTYAWDGIWRKAYTGEPMKCRNNEYDKEPVIAIHKAWLPVEFTNNPSLFNNNNIPLLLEDSRVMQIKAPVNYPLLNNQLGLPWEAPVIMHP